MIRNQLRTPRLSYVRTYIRSEDMRSCEVEYVRNTAAGNVGATEGLNCYDHIIIIITKWTNNYYYYYLMDKQLY